MVKTETGAKANKFRFASLVINGSSFYLELPPAYTRSPPPHPSFPVLISKLPHLFFRTCLLIYLDTHLYLFPFGCDNFCAAAASLTTTIASD